MATFGVCATNTVPWLFCMSLGGCRARVEVFKDELFADMGTPFEESLSCGFEELGYCRIAKGLVRIFNFIGSSCDGVGEVRSVANCRIVAQYGWRSWHVLECLHRCHP